MRTISVVLFSFLVLFPIKNIQASATDSLPGRLIVSLRQVPASTLFSLQIANLQQFETSITLLNAKREIVHVKHISQRNGIRITYDLEAFPDGVYFMEINWNNQISTWKIFMFNQSLEFRMEKYPEGKNFWLIPYDAIARQVPLIEF